MNRVKPLKMNGNSCVKKILNVFGIMGMLTLAAVILVCHPQQDKPVPSSNVPASVPMEPAEETIVMPATAVEGSLILQADKIRTSVILPENETVQDEIGQKQRLFDMLSQYRPQAAITPEGCKVNTDIDMEKQLFALINKERKRLGLDPLFWDDDLANAARKHSTDMACNDFFSHTNPDGETFDERIADEGYEYLAAGENLYAGDDAFNTARQAYFGWFYSTAHYRVMTHPELTEAGVGYVYLEGSRYGGYFTADFGTPK